MKKLVLTMLFGLIALAGYSQARWDVQFGMNFSNMTKADDAKMLPGFKLGLGLDYAFTDIWSLKSGLMFESKGYKVDEDMKVMNIYYKAPEINAGPLDILISFYNSKGTVKYSKYDGSTEDMTEIVLTD